MLLLLWSLSCKVHASMEARRKVYLVLILNSFTFSNLIEVHTTLVPHTGLFSVKIHF